MSDARGRIGWVDLTVEDAEGIRDFYAEVVGWEREDCDMGGYADYVMKPPGGEGVTGICHARGVNQGLPAVWLVYFVVPNVAESLATALARGATLLRDRRSAEGRGFVVIRDPAGAACALFQA